MLFPGAQKYKINLFPGLKIEFFEKNTPRYSAKEQVQNFSQIQSFLKSVGCPKVFRHTKTDRNTDTQIFSESSSTEVEKKESYFLVRML